MHPSQRLLPNTAQVEGELFERRAVVVTSECDLIGDFSARQALLDGNISDDQKAQNETRLLGHIHLCEVFEENTIRPILPTGSEFWKRVKNNQDVRYHRIPAAPLKNEPTASNPDLFLDFKRLFSIPTEFLYKSLELDGIERRGFIPSPWVNSLIDRLFHFQARVCVPDPDDPRQAIEGGSTDTKANLGTPILGEG